ncbi:hypothetical protein LA303_04760 [Candidatus Sulfidibacterium hydrothermale]|uniref:hypothetical protein n=1 Tax=Candidatus Sulfidibacterium hydrothermale TaxID=2875962 RepID=UPI001F0A4DBB|nr:hypothetical protein [Candidatus Sulfidibacterium hydrothermale]UBM63286.1 hypothetical protein LA303_04760 [Candidatus Sulfidibacterium hydrothermale]
MKKYILLCFLFSGVLSVLLVMSSCHSQQKERITPRIQYDVNIKSPNPNYDWWIQNIEGPQREKLVRMIIEGALSGKYQAYDYFFQPISKSAVAHILSDTLAVKVRETQPPYALKDTLIVSHINLKDIVRLRFLEEWEIDPKTLKFTKIVKGIAPVARRTDPEGKTRWQPLFWIFPDRLTAKKLQQTP